VLDRDNRDHHRGRIEEREERGADDGAELTEREDAPPLEAMIDIVLAPRKRRAAAPVPPPALQQNRANRGMLDGRVRS